MKSVTTGCGSHSHREFVLEYNPSVVPSSDVTWLLTFLERSVAAGTRYEPGQALRVGWADTLVTGSEDGQLTLLEPDWLGWLPFTYVPSVTKTLLHLRRQKDVGESLDLLDRLSFPSFLQSALVCNQLGARDCGVMERVGGGGHDSGWFLGCGAPDHDHNDPGNLTRASLYEVACLLPGTAQFCALPPGVNLAFGGERSLIVSLDGREVAIREGSYLHALALATAPRSDDSDGLRWS